MYLYNFFESLTFLKKGNAPVTPKFDEADVLYLGCKPANEVFEKIPELQISRGASTVYLYTSLHNLQLGAYDVSEIKGYLDDMGKTELDDRFVLLPMKLTEAIVYEAIWLLDIMADIPSEKSFLTHFEAGIPQLYSLYHYNTDTEDLTTPILSLFHSPLEKDLFLTKARYFIVQYCNCRIDSLEDEHGDITVCLCEPNEESCFEDIFEKTLGAYYHKPPYDIWKSKLVTSIENTELDDLIQQLSLLSEAVKLPETRS